LSLREKTGIKLPLESVIYKNILHFHMKNLLMEHIDLQNKSVLNFNQKAKARMNTLCHPLWKAGFTMFTFCRSFKDGKRLYLSSNEKWVEHYLKNNLQDNCDHLEHYLPPQDIIYGFWDAFKGDKVFDALHSRNFGHGFCIYEHYEDYVDQFDFAAHRDNYLMSNFYLQNIFFLETFIKEFKIKAFDLINNDVEKKLIIPSRPLTVKYRSFITYDKVENFMKAIKN
jgi:hypothetical protein